MLGLLWLMLAHTIQLVPMEIAPPTQLHQPALMLAHQELNNVQEQANTKSVETMTQTLALNGQLHTLVQQVRHVQAVGFAQIPAQTNAKALTRCVFLTPLTRLVR